MVWVRMRARRAHADWRPSCQCSRILQRAPRSTRRPSVPAVLALLGDRAPIVVLRETPSALGHAIDGSSPGHLRQPECPGKWSIGQVLHHLADSELVWAWRTRLVLAHDRPPLTGYDQDLWANRLHYDEGDPGEALAVFTRCSGRRTCGSSSARLRPTSGEWVCTRSVGEESLEHPSRLYAVDTICCTSDRSSASAPPSLQIRSDSALTR